MSVFDAAASGDPRRALEELRNRLAQEIDDADTPRDVATLSKQFVEVLKDLGSTEPESQGKGTVLDELRARRQAKTGS